MCGPSRRRINRYETGRCWSDLASARAFEHVRTMQRRLIVPVVGDVGGQRAVRAVGRYVREHGAAFDVFYTSNVESHLFREGRWKALYDSLQTMPFGSSAVVVRSFLGAVARVDHYRSARSLPCHVPTMGDHVPA